MKRIITLAFLCTLTMSASAQYYGDPRSNYHYSDNIYRYSNERGYHHGFSRHRKNNGTYVGLRLGPSFSKVYSADPYLDGRMKTGVNVGVALGLPVSYQAPLFLETGLYYSEKGGKGKVEGAQFRYNLGYLELPLVLKYQIFLNRKLSLQPYLGAYGAVGVSGRIKDFQEREAYTSFGNSDYSFRRGDGGIRLGCGVGYDMVYAELNFDWGLANISHNMFDESKNRSVSLNFGVNL